MPDSVTVRVSRSYSSLPLRRCSVSSVVWMVTLPRALVVSVWPASCRDHSRVSAACAAALVFLAALVAASPDLV